MADPDGAQQAPLPLKLISTMGFFIPILYQDAKKKKAQIARESSQNPSRALKCALDPGVGTSGFALLMCVRAWQILACGPPPPPMKILDPPLCSGAWLHHDNYGVYVALTGRLPRTIPQLPRRPRNCHEVATSKPGDSISWNSPYLIFTKWLYVNDLRDLYWNIVTYTP